MRSPFFLLGLVLGAAAILFAQSQGLTRVRRTAPQPEAPPVAGAAEPKADSADARGEGESDAQSVALLRAALERDLRDPQGKSLDPLAVLLEEAIFERRWAKVQAAAETVRAHGAEWVAPAVTAPPAPGVEGAGERSIWELEQEVERQRFLVEFGLRQNRAHGAGGRPRAVTELLDLVRAGESNLEREDAAWLVARSGDERAIDELVRLLADPDKGVRKAVGHALAREGYRVGEVARLLRTHALPPVRASAADALSRFQTVRAGEPGPGRTALAEAVGGDVDPLVRGAAAHALGRCDLARCRLYVEALLDAIERDQDQRVAVAVAGALRQAAERLGRPFQGQLRAFERAIRPDDPVSDVLWVLGAFGDQETLAALDAAAVGRRHVLIEEARAALRQRLAEAAPPR